MAKGHVLLENYDNFFVQDEPLKINAENALIINPKPTGSILIFNELLKGRHTPNLYFFLILSVVYFLALYKIISYLGKLKLQNKDSSVDIIFLSVFFLLIFLPMSHISTAEKSDEENRNLAARPPLRDFYDTNDYALKFEAWFNDHFYLRKNLIQIYEYMEDPFFKKGNKRVLIGKENWLFYKGDQSERNFANMDLLSNEELQAIAQYLTDINTWAKNHGKNFYYMICPDKNKIYGEFYPYQKKMRPDSESRAYQLIAYLKENTSIRIVYPYENLHQQKSFGHLLYWKNDTHWNPLGAYVGYRELLKSIQKSYKIKPFVFTKSAYKTNPKGDLTAMFSRSKKDQQSKYFLPQMEDLATCEGEEKNFQCLNTQALNKERIAVFRDSYSIAMIPYFNATFSNALYQWRYDIRRSDLKYIQDHADIIILEQVERLIPRLADLTFPKE